MDKYSYLGNADVSAVDNMYQQYLEDHNSVDHSWQKFFEGFEFSRKNYEDSGEIPQNVQKEFNVIKLINGYRSRGHLFTKTNPVRERRKYKPGLVVETFDLEQADLEEVFHAGDQIGIGPAKLKDIVAHLEQTYCQSIGVEFKYLRRPDIVNWFQDKMETSKNTPNYTPAEKLSILKQLNKAVEFESFLHTKFVGAKRFSLEGAEAIIPALEAICDKGADMGIKDFVIGMAHRGRLNILTNIMKKRYQSLFAEFEGFLSEDNFDGDVKYHLGFSCDRTNRNGNDFHISLIPNPSHLEAVGPVVQGASRAKIDNFHAGDNTKVCPILIHGDAAVAGQGVVYELIQMSQLKAYQAGGTVHIVINNQVGFTTNYLDARSSTYCTDVAKVVLSPVFHVNGDDVEALVYTVQMAMEFRQKFKRDVFIDVLCYRKYGHNEGDEPRFTQPLLYKAIAKHPNPREIYIAKLIAAGVIGEDGVKTMKANFKAILDEKLDEARRVGKAVMPTYLTSQWSELKDKGNTGFEDSLNNTAVDGEVFKQIAAQTTVLPAEKQFFNKTKKLFKARAEMLENDSYDWAMGELMAYATLMNEGHNVRFSGQDVERGTFSHRHAVVRIEDSEEQYTPLNSFGAEGNLAIYNSHLSEYAVLGFEYGYSLTTPFTLTIWEAQFGDFFNGAQIIIDQFLTSSEYKWKRMTGLVMLLPHGYEGMGPEHSSARMERFLQQSAENNWQIVNTTTPANQFHVLRRQLKRDYRKPLICFTPKKLLRYPSCVSKLEDFTDLAFQEVMDDVVVDAKEVRKVVFCTGKVYYDFVEAREKTGNNDVAFVRLEQLYPFPIDEVNAVIAKYSNATEFVWGQEESENMGAWAYIYLEFRKIQLPNNTLLGYVGRKATASVATGYSKSHNEQLEKLLNDVFV